MSSWLYEGKPLSYWLSAFFFPQGMFLIGQIRVIANINLFNYIYLYKHIYLSN